MDEKVDDWIMHIVLNENQHTRWLANNLAKRKDGPVTVVDSKYIGFEIKEGVTYTNMSIAQEAFNLPDKLYFYAYMDPAKRKRK
ncbi:hypothetical protein [Sporosarcina jiandibaonis]|uniref:hypothetical protein n=1 Tax=Sporosarcina jiandibaonis TaxID=2715535 RepID=UPI001552800D|nr:hypothetical protein [Sporosarcina jiandibaonis]